MKIFIFILLLLVAGIIVFIQNRTEKKYNVVSMNQSIEEDEGALVGIKEIVIDTTNVLEGNIEAVLGRNYFLCIDNGIFFGSNVNALRITENRPITINGNFFKINLPEIVEENILKPINEIIIWGNGLNVDNNVLAGILDINILGGGGFSRYGSYTDGKSHITKYIDYIYVNRDCNITGNAFSRMASADEKQEGRAFSLKLKKGWNVILRTQTVRDSYLWEVSHVYPINTEPKWSIYTK